jgi:hypothetical protein
MRRGHSIDTALTLVLFCVFTVSVLLVLMTGARSYSGVAASMRQSYEERTCLQYITTKLRHCSGAEAVSVAAFGDGPCLALQEQIDGTDYVTYIYLHEGMVKELFCESGVELGPEAGFVVMEVQTLVIEAASPKLLYISCTGPGGGSAETFVALRGGEGDSQ